MVIIIPEIKTKDKVTYVNITTLKNVEQAEFTNYQLQNTIQLNKHLLSFHKLQALKNISHISYNISYQDNRIGNSMTLAC